MIQISLHKSIDNPKLLKNSIVKHERRQAHCHGFVFDLKIHHFLDKMQIKKIQRLGITVLFDFG
jgi:hypothetical protein